ncbi:MAG: hypothetical protein U0936_17065 [Planctomycetaceae bacterium]
MKNREELISEIRARFKDADAGLNERQRRQWAASEAIRNGRGGITIVSEALRISPNTIKKGIAEITSPDGEANSAEAPRIRRAGGGRKPKDNSGEEYPQV